MLFVVVLVLAESLLLLLLILFTLAQERRTPLAFSPFLTSVASSSGA